MRYLVLLILFSIFCVSGVFAQEETPEVTPDSTPIKRERITAENVSTLSLYATVPLRDVSRVVWSPGGFYLAAVAQNIIYLYNMTDLSQPPTTLVHMANVRDLAFHPNGTTLATSAGGEIHLWDVETTTRRDNFDGNARFLAYSPDGNLLAYYVSDDSSLYLLDMVRRQALPISKVNAKIVGLAVSPNGGMIAAGTAEQVLLWNSRSFNTEQFGEASQNVLSEDMPSSGVAYSEDGRYFVSVEMTGLSVWDVRKKARLHSLGEEQNFGVSIMTRAGLVVGVGGDYLPGQQNRIRVWHLASGAELASVRHPGARSAAFSPEGTLIASAGGNMIYLWAAEASLPTMAQARDWSRINVIAYCDNLEQSPGQILPFQSMSLVWSWYATTPELVQDHIDAAQYSISLNNTPLTGWRYLTRTEPDAANEGLPTVYWYIPIGGYPAGNYTVNYNLMWSEAISDGLADFGPGTATPQDIGTCRFTVSG